MGYSRHELGKINMLFSLEKIGINLGFWETAHLPLPKANINTYFSFRAKCWLKGGVGGQFPRNLN